MPQPIPNPRWKIVIAICAVLLLSAPSAVGVYRALEATRGAVAAALAAGGFELAYLSLSLLSLRPELRRQARAVAVGAVCSAIALNALADYSHRVPGGLDGWPAAQRLFDPLALALALGESAPLAGLAFALASLLHRLAEGSSDETPAPPQPALSWAREAAGPALERARPEPAHVMPTTSEPRRYTCPRCGADLSLGQYGSAKKHGYCSGCRPRPG